EEFQIAVRQPTNQIAGLVEPRARLAAERMRDESLRCERRIVSITAREAVSADIKFAWNTHRNRPQKPVQHVGLHVGDRPANGGSNARSMVTGPDGSRGRNDSVLRGSVMVDQDKWDILV